ncbi:hypothetical protein ACLOJK_023483 [Asimina triloba]
MAGWDKGVNCWPESMASKEEGCRSSSAAGVDGDELSICRGTAYDRSVLPMAGFHWLRIDDLDGQKAFLRYLKDRSQDLRATKLALGIELSRKRFLWVVKPGLSTNGGSEGEDGYYSYGFKDRVGDRGRIVGWSPQQKVPTLQLPKSKFSLSIYFFMWKTESEKGGNPLGDVVDGFQLGQSHRISDPESPMMVIVAGGEEEASKRRIQRCRLASFEEEDFWHYWNVVSGLILLELKVMRLSMPKKKSLTRHLVKLVNMKQSCFKRMNLRK